MDIESVITAVGIVMSMADTAASSAAAAAASAEAAAASAESVEVGTVQEAKTYLGIT